MRNLFHNLALVVLLAATAVSFGQTKRSLNNYREPSKLGINVFEAPKDTATAEFTGIKVRVGGSSTLQFQAIDHENGWTESAAADPNSPWFESLPLIEIGDNFNLATANLDLDVQLHDGVRMHLRTYLSSRHHPEPYVKGGYIQVDNLNFIQEGLLADLMKHVTIKIGHMENNYGDMHFRRSDNAQAIYNPFVGNAIMDAFTTEVGGELYYQNNGWIGMIGLSNGKLNQAVNGPGTTSPSILAKLGYDKQINDDLRIRLTGSLYNTAQSRSVYLYTADRAGGRYYLVMENSEASASSNFRSGRFDPGFRNEVTAIMINPFVKFGGLEFFGMFETSTGRAASEFDDNGEAKDRNFTQIMAEVIYRFGNNENFYVGGRYNTVSGELQNGDDVSINRINFGGGVFLTKNTLAKIEYVSQSYKDFAPGDIRNDGKFNGVVLEAVISF